MHKRILPFCDHDPYYAEHLADYLNRQPDFRLTVVPFTDGKSFTDYLEREQPASGAVLVDEMLLPQIQAALPPRQGDGNQAEEWNWILLSEGKEDPAKICRYQSCPDLKREILQRMDGAEGPGRSTSRAGEDASRVRPPRHRAGEDTGDFHREGMEEALCSGRETGSEGGASAACPIYGIYSPLGRCGKTIFAVTLGMILAEHRPVLYLNLENFHGLGERTNDPGGPDLSEVLYRYRMEGEAGVEKILADTLVKWDLLDCLRPAFTSYDLHEISEPEWEAILACIAHAGSYEALVLDIGGQVSEVFALLDQCSRVFVPVLNDRISRAKIRQFEENLEALGMDALQRKLRRVMVPRLRSDSELADFPRQLPRGRIGSYVRQEVQELETVFEEQDRIWKNRKPSAG